MIDNTTPNDPQDAISQRISEHILDFLQYEVKSGRLPASLLPLQSGIGNIANAIVGGLANGHDDEK
jgi:acetyl-CoA hydrolase